MRFITIFTLVGLLFINMKLTFAHDFWLSPNAFHEDKAPAKIPVKFLVGHANDVGAWALGWNKIVALRTYSDGAYQDQLENIIVNNSMVKGFANVALAEEGTHVLGFESFHSFSSLEASKFNDYAKEEGLALIVEERERLNQTQTRGREIYSRKAKTILQVGNKHTDNVTVAIGHMLEIVPLRNPYQLQDNATFPISVMFRGKPLSNALVDIARLDNTSSEKQAMRTNAKGEATFKIEAQGNWIVNVIWSVPNTERGTAEFETYFSSLTFGYDK
ncbi:DUF4198 domain-containing protein [Thalassotalea sp. 1_MG-2023]|uniref:DUF4198 domain-containing protein n=1 Tax=Thalassotalea sp. 1_MG-2023 TaxID=3062680 RepID=UPI0026E47920|nr:DUF4198 domain-containing protein [Thalassotalea sp. 1_MG-2023]MDO6426701.1 DUF4198 domain-containing protein [Thalassotalea sp. 1_MG-2023]